eukprot:1390344-Karenia_brevis.AAC.1
MGNIAANDIGAVLLVDIHRTTVVRCELLAAACLVAASRDFFFRHEVLKIQLAVDLKSLAERRRRCRLEMLDTRTITKAITSGGPPEAPATQEHNVEELPLSQYVIMPDCEDVLFARMISVASDATNSG